MAKIVRSKYGFATLKLGDTLTVKAMDAASMKSSLGAFNRANMSPDTRIVLDRVRIKGNKVEFKRVQ